MIELSYIIDLLKDYKKHFPNMTFGEFLYSITRKTHLSSRPKDTQTLYWLTQIPNSEFCTAIEKLIDEEKTPETYE